MVGARYCGQLRFQPCDDSDGELVMEPSWHANDEVLGIIVVVVPVRTGNLVSRADSAVRLCRGYTIDRPPPDLT